MPRYIDADELLQDMETACNRSQFGRATAKMCVKRAPTADVVPVVRGEWVLVGTNEHDYETSVEEKCSLCGRYVYRYDTEPQDNYCPNCGCKMDGGEKHETD